ncbi:hypothetical protein SVIO_106270 [Streptomyces violaceusniger]|uniref:Uncharacterized protein n=1 Tax=Streptomyces violaceusniger TaxID=68280 RepID=A0A4D4LHT9_STRVO|nr:hypothetical protein SVIO_106270 [Streptomyces violaceusniger]
MEFGGDAAPEPEGDRAEQPGGKRFVALVGQGVGDADPDRVGSGADSRVNVQSPVTGTGTSGSSIVTVAR